MLRARCTCGYSGSTENWYYQQSNNKGCNWPKLPIRSLFEWCYRSVILGRLRKAPVDQVVANGYLRRDAIVMFASRLNPNVRLVHHVLYDHDFCTPIDVNTVRSELPVVIRIFGGGNVVNEVLGNGSITGSVDVAVGAVRS